MEAYILEFKYIHFCGFEFLFIHHEGKGKGKAIPVRGCEHT
jgi:hypothetical protein